MSKYFRCEIHKKDILTGKPFDAAYVVCISDNAVRDNLDLPQSELKNHLKKKGINDPAKCSDEEKQAILAGINVMNRFLGTGSSVKDDDELPSASKLPSEPSNMGHLEFADKGVALWLIS